MDSVASNAMKSNNPNSGVHPVDVAKTVDTSNPDPGKNQGGIAVVECFNVSFCDANGVRKDRPNGGLYVTEAETSKTVTAGGPNAETVVIALDGDKIKPGERSGGSGMGVSESGVMYPRQPEMSMQSLTRSRWALRSNRKSRSYSANQHTGNCSPSAPCGVRATDGLSR